MSNIKKIALTAAIAAGVAAVVLPVLAAAKLTPTQISCVAAAVTAREIQLTAGIQTYTQAVNAAYSARSSALQAAWANTTTSAVNAGVRVAWTAFRNAMKTATSTWKGTKQGAWKQFNSAEKTCKVPAASTDAANQSLEAVGQ